MSAEKTFFEEHPEFKSVEELGLTDPYVQEFFDENGFWPYVFTTKMKQLSSFYIEHSGARKWRMDKVAAGTRLRVTGVEPGKRVPTLILIESPTSGKKYSIEPKVFASSFLIDTTKGGTKLEPKLDDEASVASHFVEKPPLPPVDSELAEILKARRERARVTL
jgi:hypothetical protein